MVDYLNHVILQQFKNWMLPIAMIVGGVFYPFVSSLSFLTPYLIFLMLLVPYCKLSFDDMRITRLHVILLGIQILGSLALFGIIALFDPLLAQGTFICVMAPTATSAAVITGMLGGNIAVLATYTLLSNLTVATLSPLVFSLIGSQTALPFFESFGIVCRQMIPLLILPFVIAVLLKRFAPRIHRQLRERQQISFYLWAVALTIVMGNTVAFLMKQDASNYVNEIWMALLALAVCCAQFLDDFVPVSIKMAKTQSLSLNPTKISGTCGRLMCCLKYEQDAYEDALKRMPKNDSFVQTPDGLGNVCEVNVLRETMKVRLDEKPDSPRCYHNCEVCVLRNGKGSRDGIQVPQERPERYVEERPEEEVPMPLVIADFDPDAPAREERPPRRRNDRRRKGGSRPQQAGEKAPEKAEKPRQTEKKRPEATKTDEKPRSRRRKSGDRPQEGGSRPQAAKNPPKPAAPKPPQKPAGEAQEGAQSRRRPRHRGGRRRSGGGSSPASEG